MTQQELRQEYVRLTDLLTLKDCNDLAEIFLEHLWNIMNAHHGKKVATYAHKDAVMINQMMFTKLTHLKVLLKGVGYTGVDGQKLNDIIDPTIVASLVRNVFETSALFNLLFRQTQSEEELLIVYNLWSIAGLKYRQRFEPSVQAEENKEKLAEEEEQIAGLIKQIKDTDRYKTLINSSQKKIDTKIEKKDFRIVFVGNKVKSYSSWQNLCDVMKLKKETFDNIYTYFSLYSHPSQVSVFQFEVMFDKESEAFKSLTAFNFKYCFSFLSVFIADYIYLFPDAKAIFEGLSLEKQIAINSFNKILRGNDFSINDAWKNLE
jgi:hypothetical protein